MISSARQIVILTIIKNTYFFTARKSDEKVKSARPPSSTRPAFPRPSRRHLFARAPPAAPRSGRTAGAPVMGTRRVPWRDWDEWEVVRTGLTGLDSTARDAALRAVAGWRQRGRVPHAIDVTAQLMEARMHDAGVPGSPGTLPCMRVKKNRAERERDARKNETAHVFPPLLLLPVRLSGGPFHPRLSLSLRVTLRFAVGCPKSQFTDRRP